MQIDWWTLALQTVNFLIVVWLLSRLLYRPIRRVIEDREAADRKAAETAEAKLREAEETRQAFEKKSADFAETQRQEEARLHAEMEKERQALLDAAGEEARKIATEATARIGRERQQALEGLGEQIADLARDLAAKALGDRGALSGDGLFSHVDAYLDKMPATDLADLRADAVANSAGLSIVSADPMTDTEQSRWRDAMAGRFNGASVAFTTDPSLLGGVELRFPHAVLSFTVADRLRRAADELKA